MKLQSPDNTKTVARVKLTKGTPAYSIFKNAQECFAPNEWFKDKNEAIAEAEHMKHTEISKLSTQVNTLLKMDVCKIHPLIPIFQLNKL